MTGAISIEKQVAGTSGRYVARIDGVDGEAGLRFTVRGPSLISADHTEEPRRACAGPARRWRWSST
jgi:hypothetical protein